jgi:hypothetical protein
MSEYYRNIDHELNFELFELLLIFAKSNKQEKLIDFANKLDQAVVNDVAKLNQRVTSLIEVNNADELRKAQESFFKKATVFEGITYHPHETTEFVHRSNHEQIRKDGIIQLESSNHVAQLRVIKSRPDFSSEGILLLDANTGRVDNSCSANKVAPLMKELYERTELGDSTITFDLSQQSLERSISELSREWCFDFRAVGDINLKLTNILPNIMLKPDHDIELVSLSHAESTRVTPASTAPMTTKVTTLNTPNDVLVFGSMTSFFSSNEIVEYRNEMTNMLTNVYARAIVEKVGTFSREIGVAGDYNNTKFSKRLAQFDDKFQQFSLSTQVKNLLVNPLTVFNFKEIFDPQIIQEAFSINGTKKVLYIQRAVSTQLELTTRQLVDQWRLVYSDKKVLTDLVKYLSGEMSIRDIRDRRHQREWNMTLAALGSKVTENATSEDTLLTLYRIDLFLRILSSEMRNDRDNLAGPVTPTEYVSIDGAQYVPGVSEYKDVTNADDTKGGDE